jgi:hypothetical protein
MAAAARALSVADMPPIICPYNLFGNGPARSPAGVRAFLGVIA